MVSIAVLALLLVLVSQMIDNASKTTNISDQRLDIDSDARAVFDRMGRDLEGMIRRPDMDCSIYPYAQSFKTGSPGAGANDSIYFFSSANAIPAGDSHSYLAGTIGVVGYRIWEYLNGASSISGTPSFALDRLGAGTPFESSL